MLNISLPETLETFLKNQMVATGASDESEYISALLLKEKTRVAQQQRVEALLIEGIESGDSIMATDEWWDEKRSRLNNRVSTSDG